MNGKIVKTAANRQMIAANSPPHHPTPGSVWILQPRYSVRHDPGNTVSVLSPNVKMKIRRIKSRICMAADAICHFHATFSITIADMKKISKITATMRHSIEILNMTGKLKSAALSKSVLY